MVAVALICVLVLVGFWAAVEVLVRVGRTNGAAAVLLGRNVRV